MTRQYSKMDQLFEQRVFKIEFEDHTLVGDVISHDQAARVLVLHGAGNSHRGRFQWLREKLLPGGISSAAFDFVGHGETGGNLKNSSLAGRTRQACRIVEAVNIQQPLSIIAASMSAYTAVKLMEHYEVAKLILLVPAMYNAEAYEVSFNKGFSEIIRQPQSWNYSDAWKLLTQYTGRLLIIAGENDTVIPPEVITGIFDSAINAAERSLYTAPNASHFVFTDLQANDKESLNYALGLIMETLSI